jgi:hypothetical protein
MSSRVFPTLYYLQVDVRVLFEGGKGVPQVLATPSTPSRVYRGSMQCRLQALLSKRCELICVTYCTRSRYQDFHCSFKSWVSYQHNPTSHPIPSLSVLFSSPRPSKIRPPRHLNILLLSCRTSISSTSGPIRFTALRPVVSRPRALAPPKVHPITRPTLLRHNLRRSCRRSRSRRLLRRKSNRRFLILVRLHILLGNVCGAADRA